MSILEDNKRIREIEHTMHTILTTLGLRVEGQPLKGGKLQNLEQVIGLNNTPRILYGKIVDALAYANCYKVQLDGGTSTTIAVKGGQSAFSIVGGRELNTLPPGTRVVVLTNPKHLHGIILCTEPDMSLRSKLGLSDYIYQGSNVGFQVDSLHNYPYEMDSGAGIFNWAAGRPIDSLTGGEIGYIFETGTRLFIDSFMASLAINESCGIFGFYHDSLLRVAGYNHQVRTSSSELVSYNDQGEHHFVHGTTPYPFEHLGMFEAQQNPLRELSAEAAQIKEPWYSHLEPKEDDQIPFHRYMEYGGYLGQGHRRVLWAPPQDASGPYRLSGQDTPVGLFQEVISMGGAYGLQSAKSITLLKRSMAGFKPIADPQDPKGDTDEDYKFAGIFGSGAEHKVSDTLSGEDEDDGHLHAVTAVQDYHANLFNWQANHPFHYHEKDWLLQEDEDRFAEGAEPFIPQYSELQNKSRIAPPSPYTLRVDHRYTSAKYYETEAFLDLNEHGGVVLAEACGAAIVAVGGEIFIDAPANVNIRTGKNFNVMAGRDVTMRAFNSMDLSTTKKDIRVKAGNSLYGVAGVTGTGGILLESQGSGEQFDYDQDGEAVVTSGVVIKATESVTSLIGESVFLKSKGGDVTIDADRGLQRVLVNASTVENYINTGYFMHFGSQGSFRKTNAFTENVTTLCSTLGVQGVISSSESIFVADWVYAGGHFMSKFANAYPYNGVADGSSMSGTVVQYLQSMRRIIEEIFPKQYAKTLYDALLKTPWLDSGKLGNNELISKMKFGFRTTDQYKVGDNFRIFESLWQQKARMSSQQLPSWEEAAITANNKETYPYPGESAFTGQAFIQVPTKLHDHQSGSYAAYGSDYEDPEYEQLRPASLKQDYTIIDAS